MDNRSYGHIVHEMKSRTDLALHLQNQHQWLDVMDGFQLLSASELLAIHKGLHDLADIDDKGK